MTPFKTSLVFAAAAALSAAIGFAGWGWTGAAAAVAALAAVLVLAWRFGDRLVLALCGAHPPTEAEAAVLSDIAARIAHRAVVPEPRIRVIAAEQPNAFAVGRDRGHVTLVVTLGLLAALRPYEAAAVVAHLLVLAKTGRTPALTMAAALAAVAALPAAPFARLGARLKPVRFATVAVRALVAPVAAAIVRLAARPGRVHAADAGAARLSGQPLRLASALRKIARARRTTTLPAAETHPAVGLLFVVDPLRPGGLNRLFATHPGTKARVRRLEKMAVDRLNAELGGRKRMAA